MAETEDTAFVETRQRIDVHENRSRKIKISKFQKKLVIFLKFGKLRSSVAELAIATELPSRLQAVTESYHVVKSEAKEHPCGQALGVLIGDCSIIYK